MRKYIQLTLLCLCIISTSTLIAQEPSYAERYEKEYNKRIQQEYINNVYIPKDVADAFVQLNKLISKEAQANFKSVPEDQAARQFHFSFGRWMIVNWSFYEGSRLAHYFKQMGVNHPDDMATFMTITYHRYLNKQPLQAKELATYFVEKRKKEHLARKQRGQVLEEKTTKKEPKQ